MSNDKVFKHLSRKSLLIGPPGVKDRSTNSAAGGKSLDKWPQATLP